MAIWENVSLFKRLISESYNLDLKLESYQRRSQRKNYFGPGHFLTAGSEIALDWMLHIYLNSRISTQQNLNPFSKIHTSNS